MTVSILQTLATLPSGEKGPDLKLSELSTYLEKNYNTQAERDRNKRHCVRDDLYRDGGVDYMKNEVIGKVFTDPDLIRLRQQMAPFARFNNPLKRIVNELATVYAEPADREVKTGADNYEKVLDLCRMDEQMLQISRLLNLHRALLVGFRVRVRPDGTSEPVIDVATPSIVRAVLHPNDSSMVVGWLIRQSYRSASLLSNLPEWVLWTDHESALLTSDFKVIDKSYKEHSFGVCPWVPITLGPPCPGFWPGEEGEDLVSARVSIWLIDILGLKESKSANKQAVISGDGSLMARGQAADSESPIELADGQSISTIDMGVDTKTFRDMADHILEHVAQNYGMSAALINQQGVQSAEARELMRIPLRELRKQQQVPFKRFEQQFAEVMSKVIKTDMSELSFEADGWRMSFGESQTPLTGIQAIQLFLAKREAGLANTVEMIQELYGIPEAEDAMAQMQLNIKVEEQRIKEMKALMIASGQMQGAVMMAASAQKNVLLNEDKQDTTDAHGPNSGGPVQPAQTGTNYQGQVR